MPTDEKTLLIRASGGLDLATNKLDLFAQPGAAIKMVNFEAGITGGYRRVNGFAKFGTAAPGGALAAKVTSVQGYFGGVVATKGGNLYFSTTGDTWVQINKDTGGAFMDEATLALAPSLTRTTDNTEVYHYARWHNGVDEELLFVDSLGANPIGRITIRDNLGTPEYKYEHADAVNTWGSAGNERFPSFITVHRDILVAGGDPNFKNVFYYSNRNNPFDFITGSSGEVNISDEVTWVQGFRDDLIVFGKRSLKRVISLGDAAYQQIQDISDGIGCIAGASVQEVGGSLFFLSQDGVRTVSATERNSDFELGVLSSKITPTLLDRINNLSDYVVSSTVIRRRNNYRLFFYKVGSFTTGVGATLVRTPNGPQLEWNEYANIPVRDVSSLYDISNIEVAYHTALDDFVYKHDTGATFDGVGVFGYVEFPAWHFGDPFFRKTLYGVEVYVDAEGPINYSFKLKYDEKSGLGTSPGVFALDTSIPQAAYGISEYGDPSSVYGSGTVEETHFTVNGSGKLVSMIFQSTNGSSPFTLQGFLIKYQLNGRR